MKLVYTNDNCIGCNKCISSCPVLNANKAIIVDGKPKIEVNEEQCIACGACFDACEHGAREYLDDTEQFFADLKKGEKISLLLAPAFLANYPKEYESVLGGLKQLGVNRIISVSFGADITTWGYIKYITENNFTGGISQPCPAVVNYIEHYVPELIPKLIPVQSPMMCGAIYAKKYMNITDKLAFISPCVAKKFEISDPNNKGYISYNITFDHLMKYVREHQIKGPKVKDEIEYGLGSIYPMPGGLKENVYWFCGEDVFIRQMEGEKHMYHFLDEYKKRVDAGKELPFMVDALNCSKGCIYGTGVEEEKIYSEDTLFELQRIKEKSKKSVGKGPWNRRLSPKKR
ncbi:MAG: [Fe-Fe] hydrogenase large subunit C-terminal domain-containing protein, partial [Lachnospiraceae bacterium]|nr:[Fe-Fe] hydrogenase large subunit C-terminal domain-containing protein [Lachnospiraceae bacterium]